jgi:hypothetical protein
MRFDGLGLHLPANPGIAAGAAADGVKVWSLAENPPPELAAKQLEERA